MLALEIGIGQAESLSNFWREKITATSSRKTIIQVARVFSLPGMDKILIHGGHPLSGSIKISGSKNSALPILAATLLTREPCIIRRVPDLSDTHYMLQILTHLGAQVERASGTVSVTADKVKSVAPYDVVRKMRASVCVLGPLLGRCKEATVSMPGGCVIGDRPIDLHLKGFEALGAAVRVEGGNVKVFAPKLTGAVINLRGKFGPTVLGTDNVMMAAVLAEGTTVIEGAAQEPEVVDLANFLNKMGAKIEGAGHAPFDHRRRERTARRRARHHSGPDRGGNLSGGRRDLRKRHHDQTRRSRACQVGHGRAVELWFPN